MAPVQPAPVIPPPRSRDRRRVAGWRSLAAGIGLLLGVAAHGFAPTLAQTAAADPAAFIAEFLRRGAALARDHARLDREATQAWRALVADFLDIGLITRFVTGPAWRSATPEQQERLLQVVEERIALLCAARIREDGDSRFEVLGSTPLPPQDTLVASRLTADGRAPAMLDWRVQSDATGFRILDIVADGKSLMATKRAEYLAIFQRSGGDVEVFMDTLQREAEAPAE